MPLSYALCIFSFHCLSSSSRLCLCMYAHGARTHGTRAWSPRHKQKGRRCKHVDISQATMFHSFRGLASPIWLCTLLKILPSSFLSLLDRLYFCIFSFHCLSTSSHLCLCMYAHGVRTHGTRAWSPRHKQKGQRCKHVDISQAAMFRSFRGLASPIWLCTLLKLLPSSFLSLLDGLY